MAQLTPAGVILCALCLITQVLSQNTSSPNNTSTLATNQTLGGNNTVATNTNGSPAANATTAPTGAGVQTRAGVLCVLVPIAMATGLLPRRC